jgi:hypothetical protein
MKKFFNACLYVILLFGVTTYAQAQMEPVRGLEAKDMPNDAGGVILLTWEKMEYDSKDVEYVVFLKAEGDREFVEFQRFRSDRQYMDDGLQRLPFWTWEKSANHHYSIINKDPRTGEPLQNGKKYYFKVVSRGRNQEVHSKIVHAIPKGNLFNWAHFNKFIFMLLFAATIIIFIKLAKKKELFLRKIPGLTAVEEAIGRATEMGKPVYYLTGRVGLIDIVAPEKTVSTMAATVILGEVARKIAMYDTQIKVPHTDSIVFAVCQEVTKEAYIRAGRPDAYKPDSNFYVTADQFGYTAAVDGMMMRDRPAACFYMGYYYAESLLLAETGAATGAIQIAGTDAEHQLPFFVAACDYTLMGEELYAASAYLSREPVLLGTLRGQDMGKGLLMFVLFVGIIIVTVGIIAGARIFVSNIMDIFRAF